MKHFPLFILLFVCHYQSASGQFYEGQLSNRQFVWMELSPIAKDSSLTGTFFNKQTGLETALSGKLTQQGSIRLEQRTKMGESLGQFEIKKIQDSIIGSWVRTSSKSQVPLKLFLSNPAYKSSKPLPTSEKLLMTNGDTLSASMKKLRDPNGPVASMIILHTQSGLMSVSFYTFHHTFNLKTNKEVVLKDEIDPTKMANFLSKLNESATSQIQQFKASSGLSEEEWKEALGGQQAYDQSFQKANIQLKHLDQYFVASDGVHILVNGYFGLKADLSSLDANLDLLLPLNQLKPFLKSNSALSIN